MKRCIPALLLALAACEPPPQLDGGPSPAAAPAPASPLPGPLLGPGELAGGPADQAILLPGVMNIAAPVDSHIVSSCEAHVAPDYEKPPAMACAILLADLPLRDEFDRLLSYQMATAGWTYLRTLGAQHYFEKAGPGTDCASLAVFSDLDAGQLVRLLKVASLAAAPAGKAWRGYAIPATLREACGADRMKP